MTDTVTPLRGSVIEHSDKRMMLDYVAQQFDDMVAEDRTPVCLVFSLVSVKGGVKNGYITTSPVEDRNSLYISRSVATLNVDYIGWDASDAH